MGAIIYLVLKAVINAIKRHDGPALPPMRISDYGRDKRKGV